MDKQVMLVEFRVTNFRSIRDTLTFSFVKGAEKDTENTNSFKPKAPNSPSLLKSAAIYGPNAAGKSNIIRALSVMQDFVLESSSKYQAGETLPFTPFLLDENTSNEPSEFEVTLISKGVRYQYGFAATESHILEEWLFAYPKGSSQQWIDRTYDVRTGETIWGGMSGLTGGKNIWKKTTRNNALFLSTAIQLNSEQLLPIFDWFEKTLHVLVDGIMSPAYSASKCKSTPDKEKILNFLKSADLGISDLEVDEKEFDETFLPDDMPEEIKRKFLKDFKDKKYLEVETVHETSGGTLVKFSMDEESDGTRKIFALSGPWLDVLENGYVLVVDELHDNLHPHIVRYLVELFNSADCNSENAQLLFSTHDTSLLDQELLRRDQYWLCEKNRLNATELHPLSDFSPRKGESLERRYLSGRYGAVPYIRKGMLGAVC